LFFLLCSIAVHGIDSTAPVPLLCPRERPSLEDEFLRMYPKKSLDQMKVMAEDGLFIVSAIVEGMVEGEEWWYPACKCHKGLVRDSGAYYCKDCITHVYHMVPRYVNFIFQQYKTMFHALEFHLKFCY